eukprot:1898631-Pleurochrysis_carterae.AAC.4
MLCVHAASSPSAAETSRSVCDAPHAANASLRPVRVESGRGSVWCSVSPCPSSPEAPPPHVNTSSSAVSASE